MKKNDLLEVIVKAVTSLYHRVNTKFRLGSELYEKFCMQLSRHLGSVLSLLIFIIKVNVTAKHEKNEFMNELVYANYLVIISKCVENSKEKFLKWQEASESKELKAN